MDYWKKEFSTGFKDEKGLPAISGSQQSQIVSILSAGTFFGALGAAPLADILGRRIALIISAGAVFNLGVILQTVATEIPMFTAGRFFAGLGVGLISALSRFPHTSLLNSLTPPQFHYTSPKQHQNGSEVSSSAPTNWPSQSVS